MAQFATDATLRMPMAKTEITDGASLCREREQIRGADIPPLSPEVN